MDTKEHSILKQKLQDEYENIINTKWLFLNKTYEPIEKKFHRTELQDIKHINKIKKEIENKIGVIATFIFLTDFCNNFNLPGPYRNIDKALVILYHLLCGVSINQMEKYLPHTNFFRIYKYIYITKYDELNVWINNLMYNCFSNKRIRVLNSNIKNPEMVKHVTLILDGHHSKIIYEDINVNRKDLFSWKLKKPGLNTQFIIDINEIVIFVSDSLPCKDNNDDKMLINNINFNKFFTLYDNLCFDGLYKNTLNETIEKFNVRNLDLKITNFTFPIKKQKKIDLKKEEKVYNEYIGGFRSKIETFFANFGKVYKRFNGDNNVRVTKLETYNIQLRLCCVLYNIKKITDICYLDHQQKYKLWTVENFDYPNDNDIVKSLINLEYKLDNINFMKNFQADLLNSIVHDNIRDNDENNSYITNNNNNKGSYELHYIIKHEIKDGKKLYFVKWKGYNKKYNSWISEDDFVEKDILDEYNKDLMEEDL